MSEPQARHGASDVANGDDDSAAGRRDGLARPKATVTGRFWVLPILVALAVLSALAAFYLGGILQPMTNLRHFPVAILNEDAGPTGAQVVKGMQAGFDNDAYDVRVLNHDQAKTQLDNAEIYGIAVIPPNFSSKLQAYAKSALTPGRVEPAVIIVSTNPRAGTVGASIAGQTLQRAVAMMNQRVGQRLSQEVAQRTGKSPEPGAIALMLANPIEVKSTVHNVLPDGTGNGLSAFYYSLLLLLAGFIGSVVVSMMVDSMLGFVPAEVGPVYRFAEQFKISRFRTLLIKWAMIAVLALLTSAAYLLIAGKWACRLEQSGALAFQRVRDLGSGCDIHIADRRAGRPRCSGQFVRVHHPRVAVGGCDGATAGHPGVLRMAGEVRADAPSVPGRKGFAVPGRARRCGFVGVGGADRGRLAGRCAARRRRHPPLRPAGLPPCLDVAGGRYA